MTSKGFIENISDHGFFKNSFVNYTSNKSFTNGISEADNAGSSQARGIGETSLSIRTGTPRQGQSHSRTRVSTSSSSAGSPKRGCTFVNLVSSEEEEDVVDSRRKRSRYSRADSSPPESLRKQHLQENASAGSSRSFPIPEPPPEAKSGSLGPQHRQDKESHALTGPFNGSISRRPVQTFQHVEIPVKELKAVTLTESSAIAERGRFLRNLAQLRGRSVTVVNQVDQSSPSTKFRFVNESILGRGVSKAPEEVMIGCTCLQDRRKIGCEYLYCECLDDSAETKDGKKLFPYSAAKKNTGCLRDFYLESRHHIYECNANCNCEDNCKNRNVQHGRGVPLEIFKTLNRGWGLRCPVDLRKGDFIDTYRGEIITVEEANRRGAQRSVDEDNYFMNLDKFTEPEAITKTEFLEQFPDRVDWHAGKVRDGDWTVYRKDGEEMWLNPEYVPYLYVCDGMHVGGPTRFMNHSCDPNCRLFTVSYNHSDPHIYDLAFFALEEVPAGTELTFDYKDEDDRSVITLKQALEVQRRDGYMPMKCLCGTAQCRQYFFN